MFRQSCSIKLVIKSITVVVFVLLASIGSYAQIFQFNNSPKLFYPQSFFDSAKAASQLQNGNAKIIGQAFLNDNMDGAKHYASNTVVYLLPYSDYLNEWQKLNKKNKGTNNTTYLDPKVFKERKETYTDEYGNFAFSNLQSGKYYVECLINFRGKALGSQQTGNIITANGYGTIVSSTPTYEYFTYRYNGQKLAYKWVEIKENHFLKEIKLKPSAIFPLIDFEKISNIGVSSPCYRQENLQTGTCTEYFSNGQVKIISNWSKDYLDGLYKEYFQNGGIKAEGNYKKGYKTGAWKYYYEFTEKLRQQETYKYNNGISYLEGAANFYYENGGIKETDFYKNNKLEGESTTYYTNGKIKDKFYYKNGALNGKAIFYDIHGTITKEENYENGKRIE